MLFLPNEPIYVLSPGLPRQRPVTESSALPLATKGMPMVNPRTRRVAAAPSAICAPEVARLPRLSLARNKQPQDTERGCREFAAADLAAAGALAGGWPRARMEHSAAAWATRADLLHRLETRISAACSEAATAPIAIGDEG